MTVSQIGGRRTLEFVPVGEQFQEQLRALFPHEPNATRALVTPTDAIGVDELPSELVGSYQQQLRPDIQVLLSDDYKSMQVVFRLAAQGLRDCGVLVDTFRLNYVPLSTREVALKTIDDIGYTNLKVSELARRMRFAKLSDDDMRPLPLVELEGIRNESVRL
ncbi:TPA: hypothetical protein DIV49_01885 [Candidatus Saccharibacteria bacterium]|nr:hypothetical protein [Candidatus Saccharibacteria bacterium]HRJ91146.1 hypothetical protein [Candidatus Saccharibacteria bacterium]